MQFNVPGRPMRVQSPPCHHNPFINGPPEESAAAASRLPRGIPPASMFTYVYTCLCIYSVFSTYYHFFVACLGVTLCGFLTSSSQTIKDTPPHAYHPQAMLQAGWPPGGGRLQPRVSSSPPARRQGIRCQALCQARADRGTTSSMVAGGHMIATARIGCVGGMYVLDDRYTHAHTCRSLRPAGCRHHAHNSSSGCMC